MSATVTAGGALVEQWDDATRTYRRWDAAQLLVEERSYTAAESAPLDAIAADALSRQRRQTLLDALNAALNTDLDYLALTAPTAGQRAAQVDVLTRQMAWLIRLATSRLT